MTWSLVTYRTRDDGGGTAVGLRELDGTVRALPRYAGRTLLGLLGEWDAVADELRAVVVADLPALGGVPLEAPIRFPHKVVCAGANYFAHLAEMNVPPRPGRRAVLLPQAADDHGYRPRRRDRPP
jgi:2-keto-4-pentenoate hydratase/2-oxohepta-3-ene-1,7-dioic acid hydratase in catechol pathway